MRYYFSINNEEFQEVILKEKDFKKLFKKSSKMETYFDKHKIRTENDVVEMLKFYNN